MLFSQIYWISSDNAYLVSHILQFSCLLSFIVYQWISDLGSIFLSPESQFHRSRRWSPFFAISLKMSAIAGAKPMARFLCFVRTFFVPHSTCVERLANHLRTFLLTHRNSKKKSGILSQSAFLLIRQKSRSNRFICASIFYLSTNHSVTTLRIKRPIISVSEP